MRKKELKRQLQQAVADKQRLIEKHKDLEARHLETIRAEQRKTREVRNTLELVLHAPLPEIVKGKRRVNECLQQALARRAHAHSHK